jgi:hypothetical protein
MSERPETVKVDHLRKIFDPFWALGVPEPDFDWDQVKPVKKFRDSSRTHPRDDAYHMGRIRYFRDQFEAQAEIDPIEIDCVWDRECPYQPDLIDGHHRLCGAIVANMPEIPAYICGPVEMIEWLKGTGPKPDWIT